MPGSVSAVGRESPFVLWIAAVAMLPRNDKEEKTRRAKISNSEHYHFCHCEHSEAIQGISKSAALFRHALSDKEQEANKDNTLFIPAD